MALLIFRLVVGALFARHGTQKLFGWFGGNGLKETGEIFDSLGLRPGRVQAAMASVTEISAALLIAIGLIPPLAAMFVTATMTAAFLTVHMQTRQWGTNQGLELSILYVTCAFMLAGAGAGDLSLDHALGIRGASPLWAIVALAAGAIGGSGAVFSGRYLASRDSQASK